MNNIKIKNVSMVIKKLVYVAWLSVITWIAVCVIYPMMLDPNTQGASCDPYLWKEGQIYQWVWGGQPCMYTIKFLFIYIFYAQLYLLFEYVRRMIAGCNPKVGWRMVELGMWFCLNWGYLLWLTATKYGCLNVAMGWTSFVGTVVFFVPIILLAVGVRFLSNRAIVLLFFSILIVYLLLIFSSSYFLRFWS